jgi:hypothetical protein
VNITLYDVPLPDTFEMVPPVAVTSPVVKLTDVSLKVIPTVTVEPALTDVVATVAVGRTVSRMMESSAAPGASSKFPAESVARVKK